MDAPSPPSLRFLTGPSAGHMVLIEQERLVLGRSETAGLTVSDNGASREHAAIARADGVWRIEDLKSRNGTLLNGAELKAPVELKPGDRIRIGTTEFEFDLAAAPAIGTRLQLIEGPGAPRSFPLSGSVIAIGRGAAVDLGEDAKEAEHAQLALRAGAWRLRPNAGCATYLNGDSLPAEVRLKTGDRIRIGRCALDFFDGRIDDLGGQTIEGCTLATRIGAGTLGVVYRARDAEGKEVAVKLLDPGLREDAGAVARFVASARAQMRVSHPNVVGVRAVAQSATLPAAVMEWMPGGSLAEPLAKGEKLPAQRCLMLAKDLANGLGAAEALRIHHQGLRPANVLLDAEGAAAVTDFALCAPWDPLQPGEGGDPRWIAPEEAGGAAADARANQFSVGLILLQALTGRPPFGVGSRAEIAQARVAGALPALRALAPDAPPALERLLGRLLARDPQHRYATWAEARTQIDAAIAGRELAAPLGESVLGGKRPSAVLGAVQPRQKSDQVRTPSGTSPALVESESRRPTERIARAGSSARLQSSEPSLGKQLGIPSSAWAGIGILVLMVVAIAVLGSLRDAKPPPRVTDAPRREQPKAPEPALATRPLVSAPQAEPITGQPEPPSTVAVEPGLGAPAMAANGPAPTIAPRLLLASWIGGKGDQAITTVGFDAQGRVTVAGAAFTAAVDPVTGTAAIHGDIAASTRVDARPPAMTEQRTVACDGAQLNFATRQVAPQLQIAALSGPGWSWWSCDAGDALARGLAADARIDDIVPEPGGRFIALCWSEAANSVLARDPRDLDQPNPALKEMPDGAATWAILGDARTGAALRALTFPGRPCGHAVDAWGRVYLSTCARGRDDLGMRGRAGLAVIAPDLSLITDARLGGLGDQEPGIEAFSAIALKDGLLALGGTTAARELATRNPLQAAPGGGQDALLVVLRLWESRPARATKPSPMPAPGADPAPANATGGSL